MRLRHSEDSETVTAEPDDGGARVAAARSVRRIDADDASYVMVRIGEPGLRLIGNTDEPVVFPGFRADNDAIAGVHQANTRHAIVTGS